MSQQPHIKKLEDSRLWNASQAIAKQAYALLDEFPEEEKWGMQSKLRQQAFTVTTEIAEAEGALDPRDRHWNFGLARKALFGIKNIYKVANDTAIMSLIPEEMVKIDALVTMIDQELATSPAAIKQWFALMDNPNKDKLR